VRVLYGFLIEARVSGAPTPEQLAALRPILTVELHDLLRRARAMAQAEAVAHPDEKPPFVEGDLFTSLFEGATAFEILHQSEGEGQRFVAVRFRDDRETPAFVWVDTVVVAPENRRWVVADVRYGGTWDFATRGSLAQSLVATLDDPADDSPLKPSAQRAVTPEPPPLRQRNGARWILRIDGIERVKIGMRIAAVEQAMGDSARVDRIDPHGSCGDAVLTSLPAGLSLMVAGDTVVRVNVYARGVATEAGVGLGTPEGQVLTRYAGRVRVEPHPYTGPEGHYLIVEDPDHPEMRMIFETDGVRITSFRAGRLPEVEWIEGCA